MVSHNLIATTDQAGWSDHYSAELFNLYLSHVDNTTYDALCTCWTESLRQHHSEVVLTF